MLKIDKAIASSSNEIDSKVKTNKQAGASTKPKSASSRGGHKSSVSENRKPSRVPSEPRVGKSRVSTKMSSGSSKGNSRSSGTRGAKR